MPERKHCDEECSSLLYRSSLQGHLMTPDTRTASVHWLRNLVSIAPVRLLVMFIILAGIYAALASGGHAVFGRLPQQWRTLWIGFVLLVIVAVLLLVYRGLVVWIEQRRVNEVPLPPTMKLLAGGTLIGVLCLSAVYAIFAAFGMLGPVQYVGSIAVLGSLVICVIASLAEELIMRGIVFRLMEQWLGSGIAIGFSSALFGLVHLANPNATLLGAIAIAVETGMLLGGAYMLCRNLWLPIGVHFGWNLAESVIFGAHDSGLTLPGLLSIPVQGSTLASGGTFGPEASVSAMVVGTTAAGILLFFAVRRGQWQALRWRLRLPLSA
jgi:membrane protease YdiL (CAAX protease family)